VNGLELTNTGTTRMPKQSGLLIQVSDLYIHDVNGSLVKKEGGGMGIEIRNGGKVTKSCFNGLVVENCHLVRTERNGIIFNSDYWSRDKWFPNLDVVVRKCLLEEVPGDGIVPIGCEGALVEYNIMRSCTRLLPDGEAAAGIWPWSSDHTLIQYNEVSITGPVTNTLISDNVFVVPKKPFGSDLNLVKMDTWGGKWPSNTTLSGNTFYVTDSANISLGKDINTVFHQNFYVGKISNVPDKPGLLQK